MLYLYDVTRTPFLKMGTGFSDQSAADLGVHVTKSLLQRNDIDPAALSEVIFGCVCQPPDSANIARVISLRAGIPEQVPAVTVNRNCASGFEALFSAEQRMYANRGDLFIVGGVDNMTRVPFYFPDQAKAKFATLAKSRGIMGKIKSLASFRPKDVSPVIGLQQGLTDPFINMGMGETAELLANRYAISREQQDHFAADSHLKAHAALKDLEQEISPYPLHGQSIQHDNGIRSDTSPEKLANLRPVFDKTTGSVTAGNSSQISDGAAALLVGTKEAGDLHFLKPIGTLRDYSIIGCEPKMMGLGPVHAIEDLLQRSDNQTSDYSIFEINEAFASQVLACLKELQKLGFPIDPKTLNPRGGSIALGHPVGATGARMIGSLLHQLRTNHQTHGIASLCVGGGQGVAVWIEALN